ncbi:TPA: hypothetical protein P6R15_006441 [Pseudomonas aeruginosa]|uniref:hypothetical protein n=1 Tax=Bacteria TaxID=2 RepID=UPI001EEDC7A5|nr:MULTISPECIES: hypothetical protein [Bacteria]MCG7044403.1 hypothetical protein [Pseudomonas aeruginosa]HDP4772801.1 hypothetical protein [Pseudomonas aeruginosa]HDP4779110.1 hypothetical protein [Pseudomonas aeruginosa]HDP4785245.1 hypothetical protein [Pseudomonas aeruginosa]HDP4804467.1 hypothetical protein [Pseudomonas aeruginosa]
MEITDELKHFDVPIFVEYNCVSGDDEFDIDWWTVTELKQLFAITLTEKEKATRICAFKWGIGYRQWAAVYSRTEILNYRLIASEGA